MRQSVPSSRLWRCSALAALAILLGLALPSLRAQFPNEGAEPDPARQVTLFGIIATAGSNDLDPKLAGIEGQLRKLLPGHGFKLLDVRTKRLMTGQSLRSDLGNARPGFGKDRRPTRARRQRLPRGYERQQLHGPFDGNQRHIAAGGEKIGDLTARERKAP